MDPYIVAAIILGWATLVATVVAFFMGRDRLIHDPRGVWGDDQS